MVLPTKRSASSAGAGSSSSSVSRSLLKKPMTQATLSFAPGGASGSGSHAAPSARLRQASIWDLPGVRDYSEDPDTASLAVPTTLYLGESDILSLKDRLEIYDDREELLKVLRRLSTVPCTRAVLESTRIGVTVGHLRKHRDDEVRELSERIVAVWKRQLKEQTAQQKAGKPGASGARRR
jgi:hypothetical protein